MREYLDIAAALHTKSLTFFVGTGFSKYITNGAAPSWLELMAKLTEKIDKDGSLIGQLFNKTEDGEIKEAIYDLTIIAQILESEFKREKLNIKEHTAEIIRECVNESTVDKTKTDFIRDFFSRHPEINIITTNYDTIFSEFILQDTSRVFIEGGAIPRLNSHQNIYHIHGCITRPSSIVLTLNDYYNFQSSQNYFARKFFTLLQETTVCLLGYSLGDFNLNTILSEGNNNKNYTFRKSDIYNISRNVVPEIIDRFYSFTYGITTIQHTTIEPFFTQIESSYPHAKEILESVSDLQNVLSGEREYKDSFLRLRLSLSKILLQASNMGIDVNDDKFLRLLITILKKKKEFTSISGAWEQYDHFADWLIEIGSCIKIRDTSIEADYLLLVKYSLSRCSRKQYMGYSWRAWSEWKYRLKEMLLDNQFIIKDLIGSSDWDSDLEIEKIIE